MERLIDFLLLRSPRERGLLAVLILGVVPLASAFLVIQPLQQARTDAAHAASEARALRDWVAARSTEFEAMTPEPAAAGGAVAAIGASGIEQSLRAAGLREQADRLAARGGGDIELGFETVAFSDLAGWLSDTLEQSGYALASLRMTRGEGAGVVGADIVLRPLGD